MVIFMLLDEVLSAVVVVQNRGVVFQQGKDALCLRDMVMGDGLVQSVV